MKENNGAATPAAQTRVNDLKKIVLEIRGKDMGTEIEENSFCVIPRLFVDNGYMGFHVVVQVWDHKALEQEQHWNFSLWVWDSYNEYPAQEDPIHCEMIQDFGDEWFTEKANLLTIAEHLASYYKKSFK